MADALGATLAEWEHFASTLNLRRDLLPVVSNTDAQISEGSKLSSLGKVPSRYNAQRRVSGFKDWTSYFATPRDIAIWSQEPDYGICLQTRDVRALDVDIEDLTVAGSVCDAINDQLARHMPFRMRDNSSKFLIPFHLKGEYAKRILKTDWGNIEFLATGQQFVAVGTHPSGSPYKWHLRGDGAAPVAALPAEIPILSADEFDALWARLVESYGNGEVVEQDQPKQKLQLTNAQSKDSTVAALAAQGLVRAYARDGSLHITCPFASEHTDDSNESATAYYPAFTGGFERGHFHCLHAHCAARTDEDFLAALGLYNPLDAFDVLPDAPSAFDLVGAVPDSGTIVPTDNTQVSPSPIKGPRYVFESLEAFAVSPPVHWLVKGILPAAELAVIFGEPGSGKTFFALDLAMAISTGGSWSGLSSISIPQRPVLYIAAEDAHGVRHRTAAYLAQHPVAAKSIQFAALAGAPNFLVKDDVQALLAAVNASPYPRPGAIFLDTLACITPGANENSAEDMGKALAYCKALHEATGALIVLIHHSGKDASRGARGWSGLRGAVAAEIEITRVDDERIAKITKQKNGVDGEEIGFRLRRVVLGQDADGDETSSCVVEYCKLTARAESRGKGQPSLRDAAAMDIFKAGLNDRPEWRYQEFLDRFAGTLPGDDKVANQAAKRTVDRLVLKKQLVSRNGWLALPKDDLL